MHQTGLEDGHIDAGTSAKLLGETLGVTTPRARVILRALRMMPSGPTLQKAHVLLKNIPTFLVQRGRRAGKPIKASSALSLATALSAGLALHGIFLATDPVYKGMLRNLKKRKALDVPFRAPPLPLHLLKRVLADAKIPAPHRTQIALMWAGALRWKDLSRLRRHDFNFLPSGFSIRLRGAKGAETLPARKKFFPYVGRLRLVADLVKNNWVPLSRQQCVRHLRRHFPIATAHSIRRGAATHLANKGPPHKYI